MMNQVKIFASNDLESLETKINEFLEQAHKQNYSLKSIGMPPCNEGFNCMIVYEVQKTWENNND